MGSILGSTSDLPFHAFEPEIKKSKFKELCWKQSLWSVWPDGAKFLHLGKLFVGLFDIWQNFTPTLAMFYNICHISILLNGQILNK